MQQQQPSQIGEITLISRDSETLDIWAGPGSRGPPVVRSSGSVGSVSLVTNIAIVTSASKSCIRIASEGS